MSTNNKLQKVSENTMENILSRVGEMEKNGLKMPPNYSPDNALRSAWLILQETQTMGKKPVLEACTKASIANALLKMVLMGLNPVKRQCSFIAYGDKLECQREYQGSIALAKRFGLKSVTANVIFEKDDFSYEVGPDGRKKVTKHVQTLDSMGGKIKGAYAVTTMNDGTVDMEVMTWEDIQKAWCQGATKGNSPAHRNFPDEMCKKTVINRALKSIINSSDDVSLFDDDEPKQTRTEAYVDNEIKTNANKKELVFDEESEADEVEHEEVKGESEEMPDFEEQPEKEPQMADGPGF